MLSPVPAQRYRVAPISVVESIWHVTQLLRDHWEEVARNKSLMVLEPHLDAYAELERQGMLIALGAFASGDMVGYSVSTVQPHLHYAGLVYAQNDVIFVAREHRGSPLGLRMIRETERQAKTRGCRMVMWHAKPDTDLARILPRMGYGVQDIVFSTEV